MELDGGDSRGESTNASWVNAEDLGRRIRVFIIFFGDYKSVFFIQRLVVLTS